MPKKAVLIELGGSHAECLFSQIYFLRERGYEIHVICNRHLWPFLSDVHEYITGHLLVDTNVKRWKRFKMLQEVWRYIRYGGISHAIFNTTELKIVRDLLIFPFPGVEFAGLLHNGLKLSSGFTVRHFITQKVKKLFVLNDGMLPHLQASDLLQIQSLYAVFFPEMGGSTTLPKGKQEFWVCIPGEIDPRRRDIPGLIQQIQEHGLASNIRVILLGSMNADPALVEAINALPQRSQVITFGEEKISNEIFHAYIRQSDIILPLLHPPIPRFQEFFKTRISGAYNLAFAYKKPLMMEQHFEAWTDFKEHAILYPENDLVKTLHDLAGQPAVMEKKVEGLHNWPKLKFEVQCNKYIGLLEAAGR
ncbi:hypothetical protein ACE38W_12995 [Chitinophaga sp. Hz27]|uniref:hypothetical protein n=1 Tax=Chitinophaga sp. Hz27 TaxID=3347169 RepID=UPI0035E26AC5